MKKLLIMRKRKGGRNNHGHITVRHRGGEQKRFYRLIDFKRDKFNMPAKVASIEYDPNRTCNICLLNYEDGEKRYILHPSGLNIEDTVYSGESAEIKSGNCINLRNIPAGTFIHNVELKKGCGGKLGRAAGAVIQLMAKENDYALLRLASGEIRKVHLDCRATIGQIAARQEKRVLLRKAGQVRWRGRRPHVRGVAMNKVDHPHGGGKAKSKGGRHPVSPWGQLAKGYKTRRNKRTTKWIVHRRK